MYNLKQLIFYSKFLNNELPKSISNILTKQIGTRRLCHTAYFLKPPRKANTENAKLCIRYSIPNLINNFDKTFILKLPDISRLTIKKNFKKVTMPKYPSVCDIPQCFICNYSPRIFT